ncbi:DUF4358 domain-containing protein [Colidextribacter sp. OB.20]|uniref:Ig-like domain-containing protein n=1 Tax=Colidextribacter sp. OB.20 TaxID=2304568 RepID=UPI001368EA89|nr:Ig-like domain-containing protein [Colidextribacter sp. OB.20]NBI11109.1 DUF4358 domain-containing protein [Colidextribacter sp. OB.20]
MKRRIFAAVLAAAMVLSLAACGGKDSGSGSSNPGSSSSADNSGASSSQPDASPQPDGSDPSGSGSEGDVSEPGAVTITLNKTEVTLNKAGATFQLKAQISPEGGKVTFTSSDEKIITVDGKGLITAVAPGKAGVTVQCDGASQVIVSVACDWKEETKPEQKPEPKPDPKPDTSTPGSSSGSGSSSAAKVDLQAFYDATIGKYEFGYLELADKDILDMMYAGMSDISAEQMLVYVCMISMNNGEFGLVQVKDSKDVDAVKAIFQARIDYMVGDGNGPGGAQYPMAMDQWENNSRIVTNGNYVMMIVHENCDDIVSEFNALF